MKLPTPNLPAINLGPVQSFANEFVWGASLQERWSLIRGPSPGGGRSAVLASLATGARFARSVELFKLPGHENRSSPQNTQQASTILRVHL